MKQLILSFMAFLFSLSTWATAKDLGFNLITSNSVLLVGKSSQSVFFKPFARAGEEVISLPRELKARTVYGVLRAKDNQVAVITQVLEGGQDNPWIHVVDLESKKWKRIAQIDCIDFDRVDVKEKSLVFYCQEYDNRDKAVWVKKEFKKLGLTFLEPRSISFNTSFWK